MRNADNDYFDMVLEKLVVEQGIEKNEIIFRKCLRTGQFMLDLNN